MDEIVDGSDLHNLDSDYLKPFQTILIYFKFSGLDLLDDGWKFLRTIRFYILMFLLHVAVTIGSWSFLANAAASGLDLLDVIIDLSYAYGAVEGLLLYVHFVHSKEKIKSFVSNLGEEWRDDENLSSDLVALKEKKIKSLDRFHYVYFIGVSGFAHLYMLMPIGTVIIKKFIFKTDSEYILPFRLLTPFEYGNNFLLYLMVYAALYIITVSLTYLINGSVFLLTVCMSQLRVRFLLLQHEFKDIFNSKADVNIDEKIKRAVRKHSRLLNLMNELSRAFGLIFALHLFFLSGVICFYCVTAMINRKLEDQKNVMGSVISIATIYHCCYNGQLLSDASANVGTATYDSAWYGLSCEHKKIVLIIMLRSQRITFIKSTSLTYISLTVFVKVMNMTWSFISLICRMYEEE